MNISEQPLDPNFLRIHPRGYTEEPIAEDKLGGRNQMREKIAELIRELEKERKRSARWKACAKEYNAYCELYAIADTLLNSLNDNDRQTD